MMKPLVPKYITISLLAVFLTALSGIFGAPFFRILRQTYGRRVFLTVGLLATTFFVLAKAFPFAILVCSVWMTLGTYSELEGKAKYWWVSGLLSLITGSATFMLGAYVSIKSLGQEPLLLLKKATDDFVAQLQTVNPQVKLESSLLIQQVPSAVVIVILMALAMGLIFEKRALRWLTIQPRSAATQLKLLEYRLPDFFIWITMTAFLLTMVGTEWKAIAIVAINVVNVSVVLYFFQGIAVLETLLISMRAGFFTRTLTYFLVIGQLMLLVSTIGFFDYWLDFRGKIRNWKQKAPEGH